VRNITPLHAENVAQVPVLEGLVGLGTDFFALDVDLDAAGAVLQGCETGLAHDALEHHAPGHRYLMPRQPSSSAFWHGHAAPATRRHGASA
jgi:hypothetical protein